MSEGNSLLGAVSRAAGTDTAVARADHEAALTKARAEGEAAGRAAGKAEGAKEGAKAAHDRLSAILAHADVKGREAAALDLAVTAPDMPAEAVVSFVAKHGASAAEGGVRRDRLDALVPDPAVAATGGEPAAAAADPWGEHVDARNAEAKGRR